MKMVKCVDTHLSILFIWSKISPFDMSVKKTWLIIYDPILLSKFFTCSAFIQNFKNIVSTLWLPLNCLCLVKYWNENLCQCAWSSLSFVLFLTCIYILIYVMSLFSMWLQKNCISPSLLYYLSPLFDYLQSFNFILKMNEWMEWKNVIKIW